jgi:hypothetical protein
MPAKQNLILTTYTRAAATADKLMEMLDCRRVFNDTRQVAAIPDVCLIVNFGSSRLNPSLRTMRPGWTILNRPERIAVCSSKIRSYAEFQRARIPTPALTRDRHEAQRWVAADGRVLVREDGNLGGAGIIVARNADELNRADGDFYSRYLDKTHEYRFHVWDGQVIDLIQKRHREGAIAGAGQPLPEVFSHRNGFLFYREGINLNQPEYLGDKARMSEMAIAAVRALQLDFGAVDMLAKFENGRLIGYAVCEVNSAPALDGDDAKRPYVRAILDRWQRVTAGPAVVAQPEPARAVNGNAWG